MSVVKKERGKLVRGEGGPGDGTRTGLVSASVGSTVDAWSLVVGGEENGVN
jgi:hypothetical protein